MKILQPDYYDKFKCIGDKCTNTCCEGWNIWIDKESFEKYKNETDDFARRLNKNIRIVKDSDDENNYAEFKLTSKNKCSLLNDKNLCDLYINKGEEYLCRTCSIFPRTSNEYITGMLERNLEVSCPVVAKYLVDNNSKIEFIQKEEDLSELDEKIMVEWYDGIEEKDKLYLKVRDLLIKIAQERKFKIEDRLVLIKSIDSKIQVEIDKDDYLNVGNIINGAEKIIKSSICNNNLNNDALNKYKILVKIIDCIFEEEFYIDYRLRNAVDELYEFISDICKLDDSEIVKLEEEFNSYFKDKEYILENYLVYDIYKNYMNSIVDYVSERNINLLIVNYSILKVLFMSIWNKNKVLKHNNVVNTLSLYEKYLQEEFVRDSISEFLEKQELRELEKISIII